MTEKQLRKFWWWKNEDAWKDINERMENGTDSEGAKRVFEKAAFVYEIRARLKPWKKEPHWEYELPFFKLKSAHIVALSAQYRSDQVFRDFNNCDYSNGISERTPRQPLPKGSISLDGLYVEPGTTLAKIFKKDILRIVEERMKKVGAVWRKSVKRGYRNRPFPWATLEDADRMYFDFEFQNPVSHPEKAIDVLLRNYSTLEK